MAVHIMETLRRLGIDLGCREAETFLAVCYGRIKVENLTNKQIAAVRFVWNSRRFIPEEKWKGNDRKDVSYIKPLHQESEAEDEFSKEYIARIVEFINDPDNPKWKKRPERFNVVSAN